MLNSIMDNAGDFFFTFLTKLQFYKKAFLTFLMVLFHTVLRFSIVFN